MEDYIKIVTLENEIEARLLDSILTERNIPHLMRSYYDTAYDGLFQTQKGWGYVSAPEWCKEEVLEILTDLFRGELIQAEFQNRRPCGNMGKNAMSGYKHSQAFWSIRCE
jgi:hypothetical protein